MLMIQGCRGAAVETLSCTEKVNLPIFEEGSGYRSLSFCKRCSDCPLKQLIVLKDKGASEEVK